MIIKNINNIDENSNGILFIYADWCSHCDVSKDYIFSINDKFPELDLFYFDADLEDTEMYMERYGIDALPYIGVILQGELLSGHGGVLYDDGGFVTGFFNDFEDYLSIVFD